jgi:hypothetical protein
VGRRRELGLCDVVGNKAIEIYKALSLGGTHVLGIGGIKFNQYNS